MNAHEKLIDKIRKLLALAGSANVHEAALAAEKAQRLMDAHALSAEDLADSEIDPVAEGKIDFAVGPWKRLLIDGISRLNGCTCFRRRRGQFFLIGRQSDREIVVYLATYLIRQIQAAATSAYRQQYGGRRRSDARARRWAHSFSMSAAVEILRRMEESRSGAVTAIVVHRNQANAEYCERAGVALVWSEHEIRVNGYGAFLGARAGREIDWHDGVRGAREPQVLERSA